VKRVLITAFALFGAVHAFAQSAGVIEQQPNTPVALVPFSTGTPQTVATTNASGVCLCQPAFDPATNQVYFFAQPGGVPTIFAANVQTGAVRSVPITPPTAVSPLAWDSFSGKILSLTGFGPGPLHVVSIDPNIGALQTIVTTSIVNASADLALDVAGRRAFVFSNNSVGTQMLNTINLVTGTVTTVSIASATVTYEAMQYDPFTGKLIVLPNGAAGPHIESMDPLTGARQNLVTLPPSLVTVVHGLAFEPFSRTAIVFNGATNSLAFANVATAAVTNSAPIPGGLPFGIFGVAPAGANIPALAAIALALLALTLAALAVWRGGSA